MEVSTGEEELLVALRDRTRSFLADAAGRFDGPGRLLEIAAGEPYAAAYFRQAQVSTCNLASLHVQNVERLASGAFTWVVCTGALACVPDPFEAMREIHRLLQPGGYLFLASPFNLAMRQNVSDYWRFTEKGLRKLLQDFDVESLAECGSVGRPDAPLLHTAIARKRTSDAGVAPDFSALITCYFEERSIEEFHARLSPALRSLGRSFEIVFVNDGSTDRTFEKLCEIFARDPAVSVIIDLFHNAGQAAAISAAISEARGRALLLMDSDLQLAPEEIPRLVAEYDKGYDVVSGARANRKDSWLRIIPSKLANVIMRRATQSDFRDFGCTFKIFNAALVKAFDYGPHRMFSNVDVIARAARRCEVPVTHFPRRYGESGWTFRKLLKYNTDNLVSLSERPFQTLAGLCLVVAVLFTLRIVLGYLFPFRILASVSTGLLLNAILISLLITVGVMCMVGEFAIRSFLIGRNLPLYVIREVRRRMPRQDREAPADS